MNTIRITSTKVAILLGAIVSLLLIMNLLIIFLSHVLGYQHLRGFSQGFYFDAEANLPSLYSALAIVLCAVLLWLIGSLEIEKARKQSFYWKLLAVVFLLLAMDEFGSLHEFMIQPLRQLLDRASFDSDYFYFAWFIPYIILLLFLGLLLLRFLLRLPSGARLLFLLGGFVFLLGAVGMEMIGGKYWAAQGWALDGSDSVDLRYALIVTVEELLEMIGIIIFVFALTRYYLGVTGGHAFIVSIKDVTHG